MGLAFRHTGGPYAPKVVLLDKTRGPESVIGKANGPGGKINPGEHVLDAMSREFSEETGVLIPGRKWTKVGRIEGGAFSVDICRTWLSNNDHPRTAETERVFECSVDMLPDNAIDNLRYIIPMALACAPNSSLYGFVLKY